MGRGLARTSKIAFHAAADVEEDRDAHAAQLMLDVQRFPELTLVQDLEVLGRKIEDKSALAVANRR